MRTDTLIRADGMKALLDKLGMVDAERFIALMLEEPFDYTEWRQSLLDEYFDIQSLSNAAMKEYSDRHRS